LLKLLRDYGLSTLVSGLTWYMMITGMLAIFKMFDLDDEAINAAIITSGVFASIGYLFRFFHYVNQEHKKDDADESLA
jgi:hypothetical protein